MYTSLSNAIENVLMKAGNLTCLQLLLILQHRTTFPWPVGCRATSHKSSRYVPRGSSWAHGLVGDYCQSPRYLPIDTSCTTPAIPRVWKNWVCQRVYQLNHHQTSNSREWFHLEKSTRSHVIVKHTSIYQKKSQAMQKFNLWSCQGTENGTSGSKSSPRFTRSKR